MKMTSTTWIAAVAVLAATASATTVRADTTNEVRAVTFDEQNGITRVHVRGAQTPMFTVYKLDRPSRVVIDVPKAQLADALRGHEGAAVWTPDTWAVSTIAAQQLEDGAVRVIVTLARPGSYDVKTEGNEVVILVTPRDAAPKTIDPAELKQAQDQARAASETADKSRAEADAAKAEAERLRAQAEAAQRAVETMKQKEAAQAASAADLARARNDAANAKAQAAKASADADAAREVAARAQAEADRTRSAAEHAHQAALAEAAQLRDEMAKTRAEAAQAMTEAQHQREDAARTKAEAEQVAQNAQQELTAAQQARAEAEQAKTAADAQTRAAERKQAAADEARKAAEAARADAEQKRADAEAARAAVAQAQDAAAKSRAQADEARSEAQAAKAEAARARTEAAAARAQAEAARAEALAEKHQADTDKHAAELARASAEKMLAQTKQQVAALATRAAAVQQQEDQARAANAAAEARELAAQQAEDQAVHDRQAAELVAKAAAAARDGAAAKDRDKLAADAKLAEQRLASARAATEQAEARRKAAEQAAAAARSELDRDKTALASVEQQRDAAVAAATDAARKRSEAEAEAEDATRRRTAAELAATEAAKERAAAEHAARQAARSKSESEKRRAAAEAERLAAEQAAQSAEAARAAAEQQRAVAEAAATKAVAAKHDAEQSLDELLARRTAAEHAATELEARTAAEAKAQAEVAAARARKASDAELAKARAELAKVTAEREQAETELADRRRAVAEQQAESTKLQTAAAQARDAAEREEARREKLAAQRADEERALAAAQAAGGQPGQVRDVHFDGGAGRGVVEIALAGDPRVEVGEITPSHVELVIDHAALAQQLERTLDVSRFGSPVRRVSTFRDPHTPDRIHLVAEVTQPVTPKLDRDANGARWVLVASAVAQRAPRTTNIPPTVVGGFGAVSTPVAQSSVAQVPTMAQGRRRVYHGATVDLDFKDAPIHDLLRFLADTGHVNIIVPDTIDARVTVRLKRVPWDEAFEEILASHGLWYRREGNLYRIAPRAELDKEDEAEAARREAALKAEVPRPEIITLNYASADSLRQKLAGMVSPKGRIDVDDRTNSLIVNDIAGNREQIAKLAYQLDTQTPQISIEARVVEAQSTFTRQFGIQWGGNALAGAAGGNATGLQFPSSIGITGANTDAQTNSTGVALPSDFAVNLPAATGAGEGGAIGLSLGSVAGNFNLNFRLSALEDAGTVRIISAPKVTVLNNKEAKISQGVSIPISVVSAAGTNTQFVQADLSLTVKPHVSQLDCAIQMDLVITKNEPDFVNTGARGDPSILRKEARTTMLVRDGETAVLGGIYTRNSGLQYKKVPFLGDLPVLGWLFKNRTENDNRTEVLVFITPRITNKASLRCTQ